MIHFLQGPFVSDWEILEKSGIPKNKFKTSKKMDLLDEYSFSDAILKKTGK